MTIALIICIPITALVVGFLVFKSVQLGLRWQLQVQEKKPPTMDNPITQIVEQKQAEKQLEEQTSVMSEWFHGAVE